jgi:hypothetical protein
MQGIDELASAMLAIVFGAVMLVAGEFYLKNRSTHDPLRVGKMVATPQAAHSPSRFLAQEPIPISGPLSRGPRTAFELD